MIGYDDRGDHVRLWPALTLALGLLGVVLFARLAHATANNLSDCSLTVSTGSTAIAFPKSGGIGPTAPSDYLLLSNPDASAKIGVNATGGTAAIGSAGTVTLPPVPTSGRPATLVWVGSVPGSVSVIADGSTKPVTCWYR